MSCAYRAQCGAECGAECSGLGLQAAHLEPRLSGLQCAAAVGGGRLRAHARVRERPPGALEARDGGVPHDADAAVREHALGQRAA